MKKFIKEIYPYLIIILIVVFFRTYIATPVRVDGASMKSTLLDGDILVLNKLDKSFERFDIVVVSVNNTKIVKRIIGLPNEKVEYNDNVLYINDKPITQFFFETDDFSLKELYNIETLPDDYYFVMGDNRKVSSDSRDYRIGLINKSQILGTTSIRLYPFNKIGKVK